MVKGMRTYGFVGDLLLMNEVDDTDCAQDRGREGGLCCCGHCDVNRLFVVSDCCELDNQLFRQNKRVAIVKPSSKSACAGADDMGELGWLAGPPVAVAAAVQQLQLVI